MSGQCYGCGSEFGLFRKEHSCKRCGFAHCNKCLTKKIEIPNLDNEKHSVCSQCYNILTGKEKPKVVKLSPPENYKKRVAAYEQRMKNGPGAATGKPKMGKSDGELLQEKYKYYNMSKEDVELAKRLERLKEDRKKMCEPTPDTHEIESRLNDLKNARKPPDREELETRLAELKDQDPSQIHKADDKKFLLCPKKTQHEEMMNLMDEMFDEVAIENRHPKPEDEIAARLAQLKGQSGPSDSDMANNLNKSSSHLDGQYTMNIPTEGSREGKDESDKKFLEEINTLITQTAYELELDAKKAMNDLAKDKELMERLKILQDNEKEKGNKFGDVDQNETGEESDEEDEEHTMKRLIKQCLEESKIDDKVEASGHSTLLNKQHKKSNIPLEKNLPSDPDELPWCCLCNMDAVLRCHDCDDDLFCMACFRNSHDKYEIKEHKTTRYRAPKNVDS